MLVLYFCFHHNSGITLFATSFCFNDWNNLNKDQRKKLLMTFFPAEDKQQLWPNQVDPTEIC